MTVNKVQIGKISTNCYIVSNGDTLIIIDPADECDRILSLCNACPAGIFLTHGHFDHIGAVDEIKSKYPDVPVYIGCGDVEMIRDPHKNGSVSLVNNEVVLHSDVTAIESEQPIKIGEITVEPIFVPGHSKGGVCYKIDNYLFSGDIIFEGAGYGRTDIYGGSLHSLYSSIKKILNYPRETIACPGHGNSFMLKDYR